MNNNIIYKYYNCILPLATLIIGLIVFLSGVGRYIVIISFICFFIIKIFFLVIKKNTQTIDLLYLPILLISLYFDYKYGKIFKNFSYSDPTIAIFLVFIIDIITNNKIKNFIENMTDKRIFSVCPNCNFETVYLETKCNKCNYSKLLTMEQFMTNKINYSTTSNNLYNYKLCDDENIIKNINTSISSSVYKNNIQLQYTKFILTNKRIILIKTKLLSRGGWTDAESFSIESIKEIIFDKKFYKNKKIPIIDIVTNNNDHYELFFVYILNAQKKFKDIVNAICCINSDIKITESSEFNN
jgi:hypothetical protein